MSTGRDLRDPLGERDYPTSGMVEVEEGVGGGPTFKPPWAPDPNPVLFQVSSPTRVTDSLPSRVPFPGPTPISSRFRTGLDPSGRHNESAKSARSYQTHPGGGGRGFGFSFRDTNRAGNRANNRCQKSWICPLPSGRT